MDVKKVFPVPCSKFPVCFSLSAVRFPRLLLNGNSDAMKGVLKWI